MRPILVSALIDLFQRKKGNTLSKEKEKCTFKGEQEIHFQRRKRNPLSKEKGKYTIIGQGEINFQSRKGNTLSKDILTVSGFRIVLIDIDIDIFRIVFSG